MTDKAPSQLSEHPQSEVHASAFKPAEHPVTALALLRVPAWEPERLAAMTAACRADAFLSVQDYTDKLLPDYNA